MNIYIHGYFDNNLGDDLMIKMLSKRFYNHNFFIVTDNSIIANTFSNFTNITIVKSVQKKSLFNKIDLYLTIGGSIFNNLNNKKGQVSRVLRLKELKKIKKKNIKIATIGCNLGPYKNRLGISLTKQELKLNDLVTVRDEYSYNLIKKYKMNNNFYMGRDIVSSLLHCDYINKEILSDKPIYGLGISAYRSVKNKHLNMDIYQNMSKFIDGYISNNDKDVALYCFDTEYENDLVAAYHIKGLSDYKNRITIIPYLGDDRAFVEQFNKSEKHVAIRFHAAILSQVLKKPFLLFGYANKHVNYFGEDDSFYIDLHNTTDFQVEKLIKKFNSIVYKEEDINEENIHFEKLEELINEVEQSSI